jgi:hypothetical protein
MPEKKSWRDVYRVHPAAELFPMLSDDKWRELADDIKENKLKEPIVLWAKGAPDFDDKKHCYKNEIYLLDGRNRLAALELAGIPVTYHPDRIRTDSTYSAMAPAGNDISVRVFELQQPYVLTGGRMFKDEIEKDVDPYDYVISKNIHRRHLTKQQQMELIVKVLKAAEEAKGKNDLAKSARSFSPKPGKRGGSTKDSFKEKAVEAGKKAGISKSTAEKVIAKSRGRVQSQRKDKAPKAAKGSSKPQPSGNSEKLKAIVEKILGQIKGSLETELKAANNHEILEAQDLLLAGVKRIFRGLDERKKITSQTATHRETRVSV